MKYIDADLLRKEITKERRSIEGLFIEGDNNFYDGQDDAYNHVLTLISSLQQEQQEVDLEKDVESWFFNEISSKINIEHTMYYYFQECARRYFERGKQAMKEQMLKDAEECELYWDGDFLAIDLNMAALGYSERDKVKVIVLKAEEE